MADTGIVSAEESIRSRAPGQHSADADVGQHPSVDQRQMAARCWCRACSCSGENVIFMTRFKYFHIVIVQAPGSGGHAASTSYGIGY